MASRHWYRSSPQYPSCDAFADKFFGSPALAVAHRLDMNRGNERSTSIRTVARRLATGFSWGALGAFGWRALTAVSSVLVARILGPGGFGELGIVRSTANLFTVYAGFRLGTTANKHIAEYRERDPDRAGRILRMSLAMSAVFCAVTAAILIFGGGAIAEHVLSNPDISLALRIAGVFLFFQAYSSVRETVLIGTENFQAFARVNIVKGILTAALIVPGAYLWGPTGAIAGLSLAAILAYLVLQHYVREALLEFAIRDDVPFREWKCELSLLWTFALPGLLVGVISATVLWYGRVVITGLEQGYVQLGLFEAANQWRTLILFLPAVLARVAMPLLSETYGRDREGDFREAVALQFRSILLLTLPLTTIVIVFSENLMMIFGSAYQESGPILPLLMLSVFVFALNQSLRKVQDSAARRWQNLALQVGWGVVFVLVLRSQAEDYGAVGLAQAFLTAEIVLLIFQMAYVEIRIMSGTLRKVGPDMLVAAAALSVVITAHFGLIKEAYALPVSLMGSLLSFLPGAIVGWSFIGKRMRKRQGTA